MTWCREGTCQLQKRIVYLSRAEMADFFPALDIDLHDLNTFVKHEHETLKHSLNFIAQRVLAVFHQSEAKQKHSIALLQKQLDVVVDDVTNLETFVGLNVMFLMKIVLQCVPSSFKHRNRACADKGLGMIKLLGLKLPIGLQLGWTKSICVMLALMAS